MLRNSSLLNREIRRPLWPRLEWSSSEKESSGIVNFATQCSLSIVVGSGSGGKDTVVDVDGADVWVATKEAEPIKARIIMKCKMPM